MFNSIINSPSVVWLILEKPLGNSSHGFPGDNKQTEFTVTLMPFNTCLLPSRFSDGDFTGLDAFRDDLYRNPQYVLSPYGSWLAISNSPTSDSFSDWFRSHSDRNILYGDKLELGIQLETDAKGNPVFRHFNDEFFPVDGRGWGAEGQRDCFTNALRNYGYVSSNISNTRDCFIGISKH